jgi:hypothetical protein
VIASTRRMVVPAYRQSVDMRKALDALTALAVQGLERDVMSGEMFIFVNRTALQLLNHADTSCSDIRYDKPVQQWPSAILDVRAHRATFAPCPSPKAARCFTGPPRNAGFSAMPTPFAGSRKRFYRKKSRGNKMLKCGRWSFGSNWLVIATSSQKNAVKAWGLAAPS